MIKIMAVLIRPLLFWSPIRRVRRNHGLEHATVHMLSRRMRNLSIAGRAVTNGFFLYGNVETDLVHEAATEALRRLKQGEHRLAVHPNCGTGLVTAGFMTSMATLGGTAGVGNSWRERLNRLPTLILLSVVALIVSQPLGLTLQRYITTEGDPGDLEIVEVARLKTPVGSRVAVHRVWTRKG